MFWKTDFGKLLVIILIAFVIILPFLIYLTIINSQPIQTAHVEVVSTRIKKRNGAPAFGNTTSRFVTFKFPEGSETEFNVLNFKLEDFQEGDTGIISYKQRKDGTGFMGKRFVSFEKEE